MRFTFFHLMPYRPLDMAERHKHRAAWVVLPNTLYDPQKGRRRICQSYIDQLVYAEELGLRRHRASTSIIRPPTG